MAGAQPFAVVEFLFGQALSAATSVTQITDAPDTTVYHASTEQ